MMLEFRNPIPVSTQLGEGYALYVTNSGGLSNDTWLVVLDDGRFRHFTTEQLTAVDNGTLGIKTAADVHDIDLDQTLREYADLLGIESPNPRRRGDRTA